MKDPDEFDQFYQDVRGRLLLLTYCLTGDLPSSRGAVRDAFVVTWHHWRKVAKLEDPEAWTRVRACSRAQRRHTAKLWHREKGLDTEAKATLDALGTLSLSQRRVLLLSHLTTTSLAEIAREVGLTRTETERELQAATSQFALAREVPTSNVRLAFEPVRAHVEDNRWPRSPIVRRAGAARRRTHTVIGVAATVAALVVTGALVSDATGVRPTLTGEGVLAGSADPSTSPTVEPYDLPEDALLAPQQMDRATPGTRWATVRTDDNTAGDGLVMPCQQQRFADPKGTAALTRTFAPDPAAKALADPAPMAVQTAQASVSQRAASRGYATALGWFAGCGDDRAQLLDTQAVDGVGDDASLLVLRTWDGSGATLVAGVARTGQLTTTTLTRTPAGRQPSLERSARLLAEAVSGLCDLQGAGTCAFTPRLRPMAPVPASSVPAMLAEVDLPPVSGVALPWVGTEPRQARTNAAATTCDETDFASTSDNATRTFLVPGAKLPDQFGLTETVGALPAPKAAAFVAEIRADLATCSDKHMGTEVTRVKEIKEKGRDLSVWHVSTEISDNETVDYLMGVARVGTSIAQVGFVPAPKVGFAPDAFTGIVERALERLGAMPAPRA